MSGGKNDQNSSYLIPLVVGGALGAAAAAITYFSTREPPAPPHPEARSDQPKTKRRPSSHTNQKFRFDNRQRRGSGAPRGGPPYCSVCNCSLGTTCETYRPPCKHNFHSHCLIGETVCPTCRGPLKA